MESIFAGEVSSMSINPDLARLNIFSLPACPHCFGFTLSNRGIGGGGNVVLLLCVEVLAVVSSRNNDTLHFM